MEPRVVEVANSKPGQNFRDELAQGLILHGQIQYEDPTGAFHIDCFCMRANKGAESFAIDGGGEYNWRKTEYPNPPPQPEPEEEAGDA